MTQPPPDDPVRTLQLLNFQPVSAPAGLSVYKARIKDQVPPDNQEYVVTATTSSPGSDAEKAELEDLLGKIRAAFSLLSGPIPADSGDIPVDPGDMPPPEPFDPGSQIKFEVGVEFAFPVPEPVSIAATLEATTGALPLESGDTVGPRVDFRDTVEPNQRDHVWPSTGGSQKATVHVDSGYGTIRPPRQKVVANGGDRYHHYHAYGTQVIVHGDVRMVYDLDGNFIPPDA